MWEFHLLLIYKVRSCAALKDEATTRKILDYARARGKLTIASGTVDDPYILDDAVWGFSADTLKQHIASAAFIDRLIASIDILFMSYCSGQTEDIRLLSTWEAILTHFIFLINSDVSGNIEVQQHRVSYRLPLFNKGGKPYTLEIFIHEFHERCSCSQVKWDLVAMIRQSPTSPLCSVLYASTWSGDALLNACVALKDERNPLVAFVSLAHVFLSAGEPKGVYV